MPSQVWVWCQLCDSTVPPNSRVQPRRCQDNRIPHYSLSPQNETSTKRLTTKSGSKQAREQKRPQQKEHTQSVQGPLKMWPVGRVPHQTQQSVPKRSRAPLERLAGQRCRAGRTFRRPQECPREAEDKSPTLFLISLFLTRTFLRFITSIS